MKVKEIVKRVRAAIDELMQNDSDFLSASTDEANLTHVIIDKIGYALLYIIENAPEEKIDSSMLSSFTPAHVTIQAGKPVKFDIPWTILRLMSARLSSWSLSPIPVNEHSQEYLMQQDEYARGSWDRPVSALIYNYTSRTLELYSAKTDQDNIIITCIAKPSIPSVATMEADEETEVAVPSRLEAALIYQIAGLAMVAFREDVASALLGIAKRYLTNDEQQDA